MNNNQAIIESAFAEKDTLTAANASSELRTSLNETINQLDNGTLRVASKENGAWVTHEWIKKTILLTFKLNENQQLTGFSNFYDKIPLKFNDYTLDKLEESEVRIVPPACVRQGAYIGPQTVLMPSYVNIGAYVDKGTMIDTWATIGSCAQIGENVHISGGVGIGGILEPLNASPTIIEDHCFIGARSEIVEGVIIEEGAVISMGVFIGQSTPIYNRMTQETTYGRIPKNSVVISGSIPSKDGCYNKYAAIIVKTADEKTREKLNLNELLRDIE